MYHACQFVDYTCLERDVCCGFASRRLIRRGKWPITHCCKHVSTIPLPHLHPSYPRIHPRHVPTPAIVVVVMLMSMFMLMLMLMPMPMLMLMIVRMRVQSWPWTTANLKVYVSRQVQGQRSSKDIGPKPPSRLIARTGMHRSHQWRIDGVWQTVQLQPHAESGRIAATGAWYKHAYAWVMNVAGSWRLCWGRCLACGMCIKAPSACIPA